MTRIEDGGPAFPIPNASDIDGYVYASDARGMSLRDWFAGQALNGISATEVNDPAGLSKWAYNVADAMLAARNGGQ